MHKYFFHLALYNLHFHFLPGNVLNCLSQGTVLYVHYHPLTPWILDHWPLKCFCQAFLICIMLLFEACSRLLPLLSLQLLLCCYCFCLLVTSKPVVSLNRTRSQQRQTFLMFMGKELNLKTMFFTSLKTSVFWQ